MLLHPARLACFPAHRQTSGHRVPARLTMGLCDLSAVTFHFLPSANPWAAQLLPPSWLQPRPLSLSEGLWSPHPLSTPGSKASQPPPGHAWSLLRLPLASQILTTAHKPCPLSPVVTCPSSSPDEAQATQTSLPVTSTQDSGLPQGLSLGDGRVCQQGTGRRVLVAAAALPTLARRRLEQPSCRD